VLDGKEVGQTPRVLHGLRPGPHKLTVTAQGYRPATRRFTLDPGVRKHIVIRLER
jgi:hypothetical protein